VSLPEKPAVAAHVSDNAENGLDVIQRSNLMDNLDTLDLTDMQFLLVGASASHPTILTSKQMRTAYALERKGWGSVEAGGSGEKIFRLNQAGADALYEDAFYLGNKNGVVLPDHTDWADKRVNEWKETPLCEALGLADFIRSNCQPREVSNAPDLLEVANKAFDFLGGVDGAAEIRAELMAAIAKATKP
jgi:hypothetical protein